MRTIKEYERVKELADKGYNKCQISRETGIPRGSIKEWLLYGFCPKAYSDDNKKIGRYKDLNPLEYLVDSKAEAYSFILGEYLGDGYIRNLPRTYRFDIYNDRKYENLNKLIESKLGIIFPLNKVHRLPKTGCWIITVHNNNMLKFFPQHGKGSKWERDINLEIWQLEIVKKYPFEFIKGLIYSDGCTYLNKLNGRYVYSFSQKSTQIMDLMIFALKLIGIDRTYSTKKTGQHSLCISSKKHLSILFDKIPPKS